MRYQPYKVERMLRRDHWQPFHDLLGDRRQTGYTVLAWLQERGYTISHNALLRYWKVWRSRPVRLMSCSDDDLRTKIKELICRIRGRDLAILATMSEALVGTPYRGVSDAR